MAMGSLVAVVVLLLASAAIAGAAPPDPLPRSPQGSQKAQGPKKKKPVKPVKEKCKVKEYKYCYNVPIECPSHCPRNCYINCLTCSPVCLCNVPGAVCQDPRFVGGDGVTFYFHGKKDRDFCLVSDSDLHINAHFIGRRGANRTRDFTWVQAVGVLFGGGHRLYIGARKTAAWDDAVDRLAIAFDGEPVVLPAEEGARWQYSSAGLTVVRAADANSVTVEVENRFKITANVVPITEEESRVHGYGISAADGDCFAHLELGFRFLSLTGDVQGVLGQTYRGDYVSRVKMSSNMPIMGGESKYAVPHLFSTDCKVARFRGETTAAAVGTAGSIAMATESTPVLSCESGMRGGHGIVCKR